MIVQRGAYLMIQLRCDGCRTAYMTIRRDVEGASKMTVEELAGAIGDKLGELEAAAKAHELSDSNTGQRWLAQRGKAYCSQCRVIIERAQAIGA